MRVFVGRLFKLFLDLRLIVGFFGVILSVVAHELFHILTHWSEIKSISIFPDRSAIVEVIFLPSRQYDIAFEEAVAYLITLVVLLMTIKLIHEINDSKDPKNLEQTLSMVKTDSSEDMALKPHELDYLGSLLGIRPIAR